MRIMLQDEKTVKVMGVPDPVQIGWLCNAVVILKCDYGKIDAVISSLKDIIYINHMVTLIGEYSALLDNGRVSYVKLMEQIAEPLSIVRRRTWQLFKHEVVRVKPIIDLNFMTDVQVGVFVFLNVRQEFITANIKAMKQRDEIVIIQTLTNKADIMFLLQGTKPEPVYNVLTEKLAGLKGIIGVKSYFRAAIVKRYYCKDLKSELKSLTLEGKKDIDINGH